MISVRCPICDEPVKGDAAARGSFFPFCSQRCQKIDLGRWLGEQYRLPAKPKNDANSEIEEDSEFDLL